MVLCFCGLDGVVVQWANWIVISWFWLEENSG